MLWHTILNAPQAQRDLLHQALGALRAPGVTFQFSSSIAVAGHAAFTGLNYDSENQPLTFLGYGGALVHIVLKEDLDPTELAIALAHEGQHAYAFQQYAKDVAAARRAGDPAAAETAPTRVTDYELERQGYLTSAAAARALSEPNWSIGGQDRNGDGYPDNTYTIYDGRTVNTTAIDALILDLHGVSPDNPGPQLQVRYLWTWVPAPIIIGR